MLKLLSKAKEALEPFVWLLGAVGTIIGALLSVHFYVENYVKKDVISALETKYDEKISSLGSQYDDKLRKITDSVKSLQDSDAGTFKQIRSKLLDEIDSTYYFTKHFVFGAEQKPAPENASQNEGRMEEFFYAAPGDDVKVYIWSEDTNITMTITINGGKPTGLGDLDQKEWADANITPIVRASRKLDFNQFPGIGENVYEIAITPELKDRIKKNSKPGSEGPLGVDVYALLVVRRSALK
jgi:hypothetical protein